MTSSLADLFNKNPPFFNRMLERQSYYQSYGLEATARYVAIPTGFIDIDRHWGLVEHGINVIASATSMGKTALALDMALNIAESKKAGNLSKVSGIKYLNFESCTEQLLLKLISNRSEIEVDKIVNGCLSKEETKQIKDKIESLQELDFEVMGELPRREEEVLEYLEQNCKKGDVVFLDYLNLIINNIRAEPYISGVDFIRHLKLLGINKEITFVVLSQLNKKVDERQAHRPMMSDLPYGVLSNHADLVMFLLRREYYDPFDKPGTGEIIVGKNRGGDLGSITLAFRKETCRFSNYIRPYYPELN